MNNKIPLKEAVESVLQCQKDAGHPESYIIEMRKIFNRLLRLAEQHRETASPGNLHQVSLKIIRTTEQVNTATIVSSPITDV